MNLHRALSMVVKLKLYHVSPYYGSFFPGNILYIDVLYVSASIHVMTLHTLIRLPLRLDGMELEVLMYDSSGVLWV